MRCFADEECDRIFPNQFPAVLRVRLKHGEVRESRVSHNRGGPENPLSDEELEVKFERTPGAPCRPSKSRSCVARWRRSARRTPWET